MVINIPKTVEKEELDYDYLIRRKAVDLNIPLFTNVQATKRFIKSLQQFTTDKLPVKSWDEYS
jgi:carbamoyl-phosphate synthase large subunit